MQRPLEIIPGAPRVQGPAVGTTVVAITTTHSFSTENEFSPKQAITAVLFDIFNSYQKGSPNKSWKIGSRHDLL